MKMDNENRPQVCTCHDSSAVMTCARLWPDWIIRIEIVQREFSKYCNLCASKFCAKWDIELDSWGWTEREAVRDTSLVDEIWFKVSVFLERISWKISEGDIWCIFFIHFSLSDMLISCEARVQCSRRSDKKLQSCELRLGCCLEQRKFWRIVKMLLISSW